MQYMQILSDVICSVPKLCIEAKGKYSVEACAHAVSDEKDCYKARYGHRDRIDGNGRGRPKERLDWAKT